MTPNEKPAQGEELTAAASERLQGWLAGTFAYTAYRGRAPDGVPQLRSDIRAALSALDRTTLPPAEGWRPMDSAPKDGRWLFLHVPGHGPARAHWRARMGWESHNRGREITKATHWRPMFSDPSAPQGSLP